MKIIYFITNFKYPLLVLCGLAFYIAFSLARLNSLAVLLAYVTIFIGSYKLLVETYTDILNKQFGLDYIAILAVVVSLITQEYLVGIILALMLATGRNLEEYAGSSAKRSLTKLSERIPHDALVENGSNFIKKAVNKVKVGEIIIVRKGEVVPLDGILLTDEATVDESTLTGEAFPVEKYKADLLRSGILNISVVIKIKVTKEEKDSTYKKIVELVARSQREKAPLVRLADKYSLYFTIVTVVISAIAFFLHGTLESILAVLVVATPCPLILATPIALIGGMGAQAKKRIIIKKLSSIETLARVSTVVFDKTGTITLGKPKVISFKILEKSYARDTLLSIAASIERNSLHPLAKAVVEFVGKVALVRPENVTETVGLGIEGTIGGEQFALRKVAGSEGMRIGIYKKEVLLAEFLFEDEPKSESKKTIQQLKILKIDLKIFTGDKLSVAKKLVQKLGLQIDVKADLSPESKQEGIEMLKKEGRTVAMVGDGINDAPALALADVGMVFANEEQTAASEAADIVLLGGDFSSVLYSLLSSKRTIKIAQQSIVAGIGMSVICMILASVGLIPPLAGAIVQEGIDVAVILNALRASQA